MIHIDLDQQIYLNLMAVFHNPCFAIGRRLADDENVRETTLTDDLYVDLKRALGAGTFRNASNTRALRVTLDRSKERTTGSDLVIRVRASWEFLQFDRFILVECKRFLPGDGCYRDLDHNGPSAHLVDQVARMTSYTVDFSYVMLYSPLGHPTTPAPLIQPPLLPLVVYTEGATVQTNPSVPALPYPCSLIPAKNLACTRDFSPDRLALQAEYLPRIIIDNLFKGLIGADWSGSALSQAIRDTGSEVWEITLGKD